MEGGVSTDMYKHPKWQKKRLEILSRDEWKCVACSDSQSTLHVHHLTYDGDPWDVPDDWLQTLCEGCHSFLGSHPKAGVYWHKSPDKSIVAIMWCPQCAGLKFKDKGSYFKCAGCGWDCGNYLERGFCFGKQIEIVNERKEKKAKEYSVAWLKGLMTKVRKAGATDKEIFDAAFPGSAGILLIDSLQQQTRQLRDQLLNSSMTIEQEILLVEQLVKTRRALHVIVDGSLDEFDAFAELGKFEILNTEATDGTNP
jgi:hypothetical protein